MLNDTAAAPYHPYAMIDLLADPDLHLDERGKIIETLKEYSKTSFEPLLEHAEETNNSYFPTMFEELHLAAPETFED